MAVQRETYGLPDEMLQLIAASPELSAPMMQQGSAAQFATPDVRRSDLISALRGISGPANSGVTRYANKANGPALNVNLRNTRGAMSPVKLAMQRYVAPKVALASAETGTPYVKPIDLVVDSIFGDDVIEDDVIDDDIIDDDIIGDDIIDDDIIGDTVVVDTIVGGTGNDTIVGGTGNDTVTGGTGGDGTGGTGTGGTGTVGGTGTTGTGTVGTATTGTTGTGSTGNGDSLRDAITAAVGGAGGSIDNSAAGLDTSSASNALGSALTADQLASLTKPKVPNVTLEVSGNGLTLDDAGSTSQTFDYPEFLTPEELKAYESWLGTQGGGKPIFDETAGILEF